MFSTLERSFLALDWDPDLKKRYFDENAAEVSVHGLLFYLFRVDHHCSVTFFAFYQMCLFCQYKLG